MNTFSLEIVTPDGAAFSGKVQSLLTRTDDGDIEILARHADFLATVSIGRTRIILDDGTKKYASSSGGFLYVTGGAVRLVLTTFEFAEDIDKKRAEAAKERAEALISKAKSDRELDIARAKLYRALNRINVSSYK